MFSNLSTLKVTYPAYSDLSILFDLIIYVPRNETLENWNIITLIVFKSINIESNIPCFSDLIILFRRRNNVIFVLSWTLKINFQYGQQYELNKIQCNVFVHTNVLTKYSDSQETRYIVVILVATIHWHILVMIAKINHKANWMIRLDLFKYFLKCNLLNPIIIGGFNQRSCSLWLHHNEQFFYVSVLIA